MPAATASRRSRSRRRSPIAPAVAEVAVAELPVRADVSVIAAFVVRREDAALDAGAVIDWAASRLAAYKRPKQVFFLDRLPRSANGKLLRRQLRASVPPL